MKLVVVRHTSVDLPSGVCYGQSEVPLKDSFYEEAQSISATLSQFHPQYTYSSPSKRCTQLAKYLGYTPFLSPLLMELNFGDWELLKWNDIYQTEDGKYWFSHYDSAKCPNGESHYEMLRRVRSFLAKIPDDAENALIFTHGGILKALRIIIDKLSLETVLERYPSHFGEIVVFENINLSELRRKELKPIMFVGTGSDVGKSVINAGFCRLFYQDGYDPAPFKAQNMSLNSYATDDNLEIGRAQAVQAEASCIPCKVQMNPVLLKPTGDQTSQVVLNGKPVATMSAREYFASNDREELFAEVMKGYQYLSSQYSPIVIEGAGSISELNLKARDIVNMKVALATKADTYLVADIDRGGVFASIYGSIMLLSSEERACIKGILINKFRGDISLFDEGREMIKELTGIPVVGVLPYVSGLQIENEDGVALEQRQKKALNGKINIAVIRLRHISNFTDFDTLTSLDTLNVYFTDDPNQLEKADIIIIPGTKNTIADAKYLKEKALDQIIRKHHHSGKPLYGICGGYQIMGASIKDPFGVEGTVEEVDGLGILPSSTVLSKTKRTRQCHFQFLSDKTIKGDGYEIHMGTSSSEQPLLIFDNGGCDGTYLSPKCWGTYVHGILDNSEVINSIVQCVDPQFYTRIDRRAAKDRTYNELADIIRKHVDIKYIYSSLEDSLEERNKR